MKQSVLCLALASTVLIATPAAATVVSLNFEGVNATYPSGFAQILDYYNGGTSSVGTTGTNYGVSFPTNALAICLNTPGTQCSNTSRGGLGDPNSQLGGLFFLAGDSTILNYAAGFDTGFSFNYVSRTQPGTITVYDGLNGTGNLLATLLLAPNATGCGSSYSAAFCPFSAAGVSFSGTAQSIVFGGVANQIVFDDITFGSSIPGTSGVPEPASWAMMLLGFGATGVALRRKRRRKALAIA
jgi:hypothetical protein